MNMLLFPTCMLKRDSIFAYQLILMIYCSVVNLKDWFDINCKPLIATSIEFFNYLFIQALGGRGGPELGAGC